MASVELKLLHGELELSVALVAKVLRSYGIGHWQPTLVVRNPDPTKPGEWLIVGNDNLHLVGDLLLKQLPLTPKDGAA